ncbi:hypothetical protein J1N35_003394 [Gossypium stocksii]|uniref:Uncharacterized protein n=1 Tax=Gossypium stocksii TaxID=47602 RepID=A0A9D4ANL2_9ROSI|nr:hypothetical protein J1N35_003394 [Gossypium stocksii]
MEIMLLAEKLEQAENQLAHSRIAPLGPPRKKVNIVSVICIVGSSYLEVIKDIIFYSVRQSSGSRKEQSLPKPMVEA